jgi:hypothetical protein
MIQIWEGEGGGGGESDTVSQMSETTSPVADCHTPEELNL